VPSAQAGEPLVLVDSEEGKPKLLVVAVQQPTSRRRRRYQRRATPQPGPCGHDHDGTCTDRRDDVDDIDDIDERARTLATAAGRSDNSIATLSLSINRRRYDGAAVDAVARETLGMLPDRLIHIAQEALNLLARLDQLSDIQRWAWSPLPQLAHTTRTAARRAV
jgi:hypothetical protein